MSSPRFELSPEAEDDLNAILDYSLAKWGEDQQRRYAAIFEERFAAIRRFPFSGTPRPNIGPTLRSLRAGSHIIYFRVEEDVIRVMRILHARMDPTRHDLA